MATGTENRESALGYGATGGPADGAPPPRRGGASWVTGLLALLLIGAVAWALIATFADEESAGPDAGITLSELTSDPEELIGSTVVVSGEISDVVGEEDEAITARTGATTGFVLGDDEEVLVLGTRIPQLAALRGNENLAEGDVVQVTGTVREFDRPALEEDLGGFDDEAFSVFGDRPVLMASAVHLVPTTARQQGEQVTIAAAELADAPEEYLGQQLTVRDVRVDQADELLSPRALGFDEEILIVGQNGPTNVEPGFTGTASGTLIEASTARLLNTLNLPGGADLFAEIGIDEREFGEFEYVLVASEFRPSR